MTPDILELPPVAHIVADLDDYETQEFSIERLAVETWVSPTRRPSSRPSRFQFTIAALTTLTVAGWR
jgi:hypothetical protein